MLLIKKEFSSKKIAFNKSFSAIGSKSQEDLLALGILALESNDKSILKLFDKLPALDSLKKMKTDRELGKVVRVVAGKEESEVKKMVPEMKDMVMTPDKTKIKPAKTS